jgi:uncharacterized protein YdbL (DUF1318 family)
VEDAEKDVASTLAALDASMDALRARDDTPEKFKAFGVLTEGLSNRSDEAAAERRDVAARIREGRKASLRPLADELGISTTRLHQLINAGKKDRKKE